MRRATGFIAQNVGHLEISIHALHEESDYQNRRVADHCSISIHALHEESDSMYDALELSARISIHALHEESDLSCRVAV